MRRVAVPMAAIGIVAVVFAIGLALGDDGDRSGLRVNGSDIAADIWEGLDTGSTTQPPRCIPETEDGIGRWKCTYFGDLPRGRPAFKSALRGKQRITVVTVNVDEDGSLGVVTESGERTAGCCVDVRE